MIWAPTLKPELNPIGATELIASSDLSQDPQL